MTDVIDSFRGEYAFLSNFYEHPVEFEGIVYSTNEHAFQAAKTPGTIPRLQVARAKTPSEAKRIGRTLPLRPHWDEYLRYEVMYQLVCKKFRLSFADRLVDTGDAILIEGNTWGDTTWGCTKRSTPSMAGQNWQGHNLLGWMLMRVRNEL